MTLEAWRKAVADAVAEATSATALTCPSCRSKAEAQAVDNLRQQLLNACELIGCSGMGPSCREHPERCDVVKKLLHGKGAPC